MSSPKSLSPKERKIPHNWTEKTLGECAKTHMDQLCNAYFNYASGPQRDLAMRQLIESYNRIEVSVVNGLTFTTV